VTLSEAPGRSSIALGLGLGGYSLWQVMQFALTLALSLLVLRRQAQAGRLARG
jgi:hypothetical protein